VRMKFCYARIPVAWLHHVAALLGASRHCCVFCGLDLALGNFQPLVAAFERRRATLRGYMPVSGDSISSSA
jgi:hypothetical protein